VLPYRTADDRIDGVVITFVDITDRKHTENQLQWSESRHRLIVESVTDYAIFTTDAAGVIDTWNPAAARVFGYADLEALGRSASMLFTREDRERGVPDEEMRRADREGRAADERWHLRRDGSKFFASGVIAPLRDAAGTVTGFVKIARDLTERKRREDELWQAHADLGARVQERTQQLKTANRALDTEHGERRQAEEQVRSLLRRLVTIQEDERRRLSRDLHDQLGQHLAGLGLKLDALAKRGARGLNAGVEDVRRTIGQLDNDLDLIAWELRPAVLDDLGLVVTLDNFVRDWSKEFRIAAEFHSRGLESFRLPLEIETNLYRIVQEALNNVYKHARAHRVGVILERRDDQAVLIVEDDGVGFDPTETDVADRERIGLVGIRERAAIIGSTLEVETAPGRGTTIFVRFPLLLGPPEPSS
jgi:PAS domain S-box-containing protein